MLVNNLATAFNTLCGVAVDLAEHPVALFAAVLGTVMVFSVAKLARRGR